MVVNIGGCGLCVCMFVLISRWCWTVRVAVVKAVDRNDSGDRG